MASPSVSYMIFYTSGSLETTVYYVPAAAVCPGSFCHNAILIASPSKGAILLLLDPSQLCCQLVFCRSSYTVPTSACLSSWSVIYSAYASFCLSPSSYCILVCSSFTKGCSYNARASIDLPSIPNSPWTAEAPVPWIFCLKPGETLVLVSAMSIPAALRWVSNSSTQDSRSSILESRWSSSWSFSLSSWS